MADVLLDRGLSADHVIGLDLEIRQAGQPDTVRSLSWSGDASTPVGLSFASVVGQVLDLTLSLHLHSTQTGGSLAYATGEQWLTGAAAQFDGQLTVSAVPEPESYAMLLAGLGLVGLIARRR
ncbi:MAG: PEP-CTERM sorting domain-containing protein [Proteobacteria bacterium]|nr:MAG: PEP-CTERM sorting domain-containing protein [Pseudomonadota bacterium]